MTTRRPPFLSQRGQRILDLLEIDERRSVRELQALTGTSSTSVIEYALGQLERFGHIRRRHGIARGISIVREPAICPHCGKTIGG